MSRKTIAGNWKMYKTRPEAIALTEGILAGAGGLSAGVELLVFPPFTAVAAVAERARASRLKVGGQNLHAAAEGAFTGEVSGRMLLEAGATHVLVGHSERRQLFGETDETLRRKVAAALDQGLTPVFCLGETLDEREGERTEAVIERQVSLGLADLAPATLSKILIAYEPVWAIGTGRTATPDQAEEAHAFLRRQLLSRWGETAATVPLLYGGSVKPSNAFELLSRSDVDGLLIGGASLEASSFLGIARAASDLVA